MGPAELLEYDRKKLRGVVLEEGSLTAHVTIVARAMGVPVLGRVPGLKRLFGSSRELETKTELVILLRPIVVDDDGDWPRIIQPAADRLTALGN